MFAQILGMLGKRFAHLVQRGRRGIGLAGLVIHFQHIAANRVMHHVGLALVAQLALAGRCLLQCLGQLARLPVVHRAQHQQGQRCHDGQNGQAGADTQLVQHGDISGLCTQRQQAINRLILINIQRDLVEWYAMAARFVSLAWLMPG